MAIYYHGSSVLFDSVSLSHALEGDGKAKYGYGVYVTSKYETAAHYAYNKKRPQNKDFYVYTFEIPDPTPENCLPLYKGVPVPASIVRRAEAKLGEAIPSEAKAEGIAFRKYLANLVTDNRKSIAAMTGKATVEAEMAASRFLLGIGVELIEWPQGSWTNPSPEKRNIAVLDDTSVRTLKIERVQLDPKEHHLIPGSEMLVKEF